MKLNQAGTHDRCTTKGLSSCSMEPTGVIPMPVPTPPPELPETLPSPPPEVSDDTNSGGVPSIVVPVAVGASLLIGIAAGILILFIRHKMQKTFAVSEQQQTAVPENEEQFEMAENDAYTEVIATEWNEAYMTSTKSIPAGQNAAYGVTQLEGGNTLNREDTADGGYVINQLVYDEHSGQHTQQNIEHSYEYVQ